MKSRSTLPLLIALAVAAAPGVAPAGEGAGHMHGPDGRHIAVADTFGAASGPSVLSHHDLKITDTRQPGPDGDGKLVEGCDVHSVIHRKGDPKAVIHREHNAYEPENGVYGSHMVYREPGEYVLQEKVTMPDGKVYTVEFPIWVPDPNPRKGEGGVSPLFLGLGGFLVLCLLIGAFLLGRRSGRRAVAHLSLFTLLAALFPVGTAQAGEGPGHMHGPDGRHIAVSSTSGDAPTPLRAFPGPNREEFAVKTVGHYRFRLSIENEELAPPDPEVVTLTPGAARTIGLETALARAERVGNGLATTGQVRPNPNGAVTVNARVAGRVLRVGVMPGDPVRAGQVIAVVDSTEIADAQAALPRAQAESRQAEAARSTARAEVRQAQARRAESEAALDRLRAQQAEAEAEVGRARAEVEVARSKAESARKVLARQRSLAAAGAFAQGPVEQARAAVTAAEGELRQAQEGRTNAEAQARRLEQGFSSGVTARKDLEAAQTAAAQARIRVATAQGHLDLARAALAREERIQRENLRNSREVQQAEADAETATLSIRTAEAALARQQSAVEAAKALVASGKRAVQTAEAQVQAARSELAGAGAAVGAARRGVLAALDRLKLLGATPGGGSQVTVTAPIAGAVETRPVNAGEVIAAGQTLCTLLNTHTVWVESDVFERELPRVRVGQRVTLGAEAVPGRTFVGTVAYISHEVNPETRAVRVRTVVPNRGGVLKPNMFVRVVISPGDGQGVTVPLEALQEDGGDQVVFVQEGEGYRRRTVQVGPTLGSQVVITSGVKPGDRVVTQGAYQLLARVKRG